MALSASRGQISPPPTPLFFQWSVDDDADWLQAQPLGEIVLVGVDASALISGVYQAAVTVMAEAGVLGSPVQVPVMLLVSDLVYPVYLPLVLRSPGL